MQDLNLSETTFDDENMRVLKQKTDLKTLILNKTRFSDIEMPSLAGLTKMHDLGLEGTKITDTGMAAVKEMTELEQPFRWYDRRDRPGIGLSSQKGPHVDDAGGQGGDNGEATG
jgi:hypothetical protein